MRRFSPNEPSDFRREPHAEPGDAVLLLDSDTENSSASSETVAAGNGSGTTGVLVLAAAVAILFVLFTANGGGSDVGAADGSDLPAAAQGSSGGAEPGVQEAANGFVPWPDPPVDHDPHVMGRPGNQEPVRESLAGVTLVYVNDRGRPTVVDLSTGNQRELDVAGTRTRDEFFVERGNVVSLELTSQGLPVSQGRAFVFSVHRTARPGDHPIDEEQMMPAMSGPSLCLDGGGCSEVPFVSGTFGGGDDQAAAIEAEVGPIKVMADLLGAGWWARDRRWTIFALGDAASEPEIRLPTPMDTAVIWLITHPVS